jgi:hypothetical protein
VLIVSVKKIIVKARSPVTSGLLVSAEGLAVQCTISFLYLVLASISQLILVSTLYMILFAISTDPMNIRYVIPVLHSQQAQTILTFFLVFLFNQSIGFTFSTTASSSIVRAGCCLIFPGNQHPVRSGQRKHHSSHNARPINLSIVGFTVIYYLYFKIFITR